MNSFALVKIRAYDRAALKFSENDAITNFSPSLYKEEMTVDTGAGIISWFQWLIFSFCLCISKTLT